MSDFIFPFLVWQTYLHVSETIYDESTWKHLCIFVFIITSLLCCFIISKYAGTHMNPNNKKLLPIA